MSCPDLHDPNKIALCFSVLQRIPCLRRDLCHFSHTATPENSQTCTYFLAGRCNRGNYCPYPHVRVNPEADLCPDFAFAGYCENGAHCEKRHVRQCRDYGRTGVCSNHRCRLAHIHDSEGKRKREQKHPTSGTDHQTKPTPFGSLIAKQPHELASAVSVSEDEEMDLDAVSDAGSFSEQRDYIPL